MTDTKDTDIQEKVIINGQEMPEEGSAVIDIEIDKRGLENPPEPVEDFVKPDPRTMAKMVIGQYLMLRNCNEYATYYCDGLANLSGDERYREVADRTRDVIDNKITEAVADIAEMYEIPDCDLGELEFAVADLRKKQLEEKAEQEETSNEL